MASTSFQVGAGDNSDEGEFDWEAAVREIDDACQNAPVSSFGHQGYTTPNAEPGPEPSDFYRTKDKCRQATLDRFVVSYVANRAKKIDQNSSREGRWRENVERLSEEGGEESLVEIDLEAAKTWIYPVNVPLRDYQLSITKSALFSNTLVALPTGLGKTLIAAVVMYNYFRWFPNGKIVFSAPSRPLVMQQIEACHNIVGIPQEWTIDMTGQMSPPIRSGFWKSKRVFFVTPQVFEKDIQSGICLVKHLVCLVIDEAHRALGNYSYCVAVRELMAVPVQLRILALTATPGSKRQTIQNVIDNLCISTLEYRNESDYDVNPYVHDRKLELIQVPISDDVSRINNLLLDVINPFVARLCTIGVLHNRDCSTLSPCELLNSRDKFRQAPPNFPQVNYGEVEGYFAALITLYHIRKLLSSHGIRPAYELLEDKLLQGSFARIMSRNQNIWNAKLLMQESLSHGAPNPKLVKMMEILVDHFKANDPKNSRVIIFSNFRGSVKDIMDSLSSISDVVRATEFIGQSSGKTLKGQTQKVQQAVLQKFRSGGYNVIVATSIGEEGLDIMEVDLVICFDANVSPLRMIQRMGRTGRKHDGRVVVLACEGTEMKGYLKKKASSNAIRKHMDNGGVKSFNFHASPRMVPHICKPEVQYVKMSIEQFVPRGKKLKVDTACQSPISREISDEEKGLIARYFNSRKEDIWKPSLIAYPSFQALPSRVNQVNHSFKTTTMLIDTMQCLQGLSLSKIVKDSLFKVEVFNDPLSGIITEQDKLIKGSASDVPEDVLQERVCVEAPPGGSSKANDMCHVSQVNLQKSSDHSFIYGGRFVSINAIGTVSILSVPVLPLKGSEFSMNLASEHVSEYPSNTRNETTPTKVSTLFDNLTSKLKNDSETEVPVFTESMCLGKKEETTAGSADQNVLKGNRREAFLLKAGVDKQICPGDTTLERAACGKQSKEILRNMELSPRLSHFIEEGLVPESPIDTCKVKNNVCTDLTPQHTYSSAHHEKFLMDVASCSRRLPNTPFKESHTPCHGSPSIREPSSKMCMQIFDNDVIQGSPLIQSLLGNPLNTNSYEDWHTSPGGALNSISHAPKFRRLCKQGDKVARLPPNTMMDRYNCPSRSKRNNKRLGPDKKVCHQGKMMAGKGCVNDFFDEEAQVSEDVEISEDEKEKENEDQYEDSFIDDRSNPTESSTQDENSGGELLAFYRRSLLTQSPAEGLPNYLATSDDSVSPKTSGSPSCSEKMHTSLHTPKAAPSSADRFTGGNSATCNLHCMETSAVKMPGEISTTQRECSSKLEARKRKLSFRQSCSSSNGNFQPKHVMQLEQSDKPPPNECHMVVDDLSCDDEFYQSLDLDAVEAQATDLLRCKSGLPVSQISTIFPDGFPGSENQGGNQFSHPSFDLGV